MFADKSYINFCAAVVSRANNTRAPKTMAVFKNLADKMKVRPVVLLQGLEKILVVTLIRESVSLVLF